MQLTLSVISFLTIITLSFFIWKTRTQGRRRAIVGLIFLATSSIGMALALNSIYSLVFYASHLILLGMAIILALREQIEQKKISGGK